MARPIEATPVLKGKDAKAFLEDTRMAEPVCPERVRWLDNLAEESRAAEQRGKEERPPTHVGFSR